MTNNVVFAFLKELLMRLFSKSPRFFVVLQTIAIAAWVVTGLPDILTEFGVVLPAALSALTSKAVSVASLIVALASRLAVIDPSNLPFTKPVEPTPAEPVEPNP